MANDAIIKSDQGGINARILAKEVKADFQRVEAASRKIPTSFCSPEIKRLFVRYFNSMQLNTHFISVMARAKLPHETVEKVEAGLQQQLDKLTAEVDKAIDGAAALCTAHGITSLASYDTEPLTLEVKVISKFGRRYLELLSKVDQLMPMLETLAIDDVIELRELDRRKAQFKRAVRQIAGAARNFKSGLQRRMNAASEKPTQAGSKALANGSGNSMSDAGDGKIVGGRIHASTVPVSDLTEDDFRESKNK